MWYHLSLQASDIYQRQDSIPLDTPDWLHSLALYKYMSSPQTQARPQRPRPYVPKIDRATAPPPQQLPQEPQYRHHDMMQGSDVRHSAVTRNPTLTTRLGSISTNLSNGQSKVLVGSSDYLILGVNSHHNNNNNNNTDLNHPFPAYDANTSSTKSTISRLTKKLSKHKKPSNEFPADEITEGGVSSTIDGHELNDSYSSNHKIQMEHIGFAYDEMRNDDTDQNIDETIQLLDISASRTSVSSSSSDGSVTQQIDSNHAVVLATTNHSLNTTSNSSIPTNQSGSTPSPPRPKPRQRPPLSMTPSANRNALSKYNHYDWSYAEETTTPISSQQRRQGRAIRFDDLDANHEKYSNVTENFDDSTLAISNTSMDTGLIGSGNTSPDTSFEMTDGPAMITPTSTELTRTSKNKSKKKVTIDDSQPQGKSRSTTISSPVRSPLEHDTLVIVEDDEKALEFRHTSVILQYASAELAHFLLECKPEDSEDELNHDSVRATRRGDDSNIQYTIYVSVQDANDWRSLQPFLEPHAVQPAVVTPNNLPVLLPWFQQLKLNVLLQECDMQLLYHLVTPPSSPTSLDPFQSSNHDDIQERFGTDDYLTVSNTLRLGAIAVKAGLDRTAKQAFIVASTWLERFPNVWLQQDQEHYNSIELLVQALNLMAQCLLARNVDESLDLGESFESVDSITWESLFEPSEASYLFSSMIGFLPIDCVNRQQIQNCTNVRQLLTNPLCPYLIREGIQKKSYTNKVEPRVMSIQNSDNECDRPAIDELHFTPVASSDENVEMVADNETILTENLSLQQKQMKFNQTVENSRHKNSSLLQVAEELHAGWNSLWMKLAVATTSGAHIEKQEREYSMNNAIYRVLSHTLSDQQSEMVMLQSPKELSDWLHVVWDKLCHPPTFGAHHPNNKDVSEKKKKKRGLDKPSRMVVSSSSSPSDPTKLVSVLRSNVSHITENNCSNGITTTAGLDELVTTNDDDAMNSSLRRTFAC